MREALLEAKAAAARSETPVGAVVYDPATHQIIARAGNRVREGTDPTAHAEILALRLAAQSLGQERLTGLDLYVTLEPCAMCAGAIASARIARLFFGASDPKSGGVLHGARVFAHPQSHHAPEVFDGFCETEAAQLLRAFFAARR